MKKFFITLLITLCFTIIGVSAANQDWARLPDGDVTLNGQVITYEENAYHQYPVLFYKEIVYFPMTYHDCRYLGLTTKWNNDTKTLYIEKTNITCAYKDYKWEWKNDKVNIVSICNFNIVINGKEIDNSKEDYPLLTFRDVTYFPLTWRFAVDEFGWEYSYDHERGLVINSENYHVKTVNLPYIAPLGNVATDGKYYYYSGDKDGKKVVFRALENDTSNPEIIHDQLESPLTQYASFINSTDGIYITYFAGYSGITGSNRYFKIEDNGLVTEKIPDDNYSYGKHGYHELKVEKDGIKVTGVHHGIDGKTEFSYEKEGIVYDVKPLDGWVRVGEKRNGVMLSSVKASSVKIFNDKIYYTAIDYQTKDDSALYCIDTNTNENKKIIDGVCGFYVYNGWDNELGQDTTMIIYDNNGRLMRYKENTAVSSPIEEKGEDGLILLDASGGYNISTIQRTSDGKKTVVKFFDCYASGFGSIKGKVFETNTGTEYIATDDILCVYTVGESPNDDIRIIIPSSYYFSSDAPDSVFIYDNTLIYKTGNTVARVELK